jgi:predicted type IV restriction endonuclease
MLYHATLAGQASRERVGTLPVPSVDRLVISLASIFTAQCRRQIIFEAAKSRRSSGLESGDAVLTTERGNANVAWLMWKDRARNDLQTKLTL